MIKKLFQVFVLLCFVSTAYAQILPKGNPKKIINIAVPKGYERVKIQGNTFAAYLRNLPLKQNNNTVLLYNGRAKGNQTAQYAVVKMEVGKRDLQQCADAIMRLRAEYLRKSNQADKIHFNFTSGHKAEYKKYAQGYRAVVKGNKVSWVKKAQPDTSYKAFRKYLDVVFMYAGSYSLKKELAKVAKTNDIKIGDSFIQGGFPGHAIIVVDMAVNKSNGTKMFMLAQSFMPAQEIHVLTNFSDSKLSPWYNIAFGNSLHTPEWTFTASDLMRFKDE